MAKYPDEIYEPRVRENRSGVVYDKEKKSVWFKEDADDIENEIIAVEEFLGLPAGQAGKIPKVKGTEDGFEYVELPPPGAHHETHENGGDDEISVAGLSGELADPQPPKAHKTTHENGGDDEISVAGLSGELADPQPPKAHAGSHAEGESDPLTEAAIGAVSSITFIIDGGGSAITTGQKGHLEIPFKCEIQRVTLLADQVGSIVVDIWKDSYANFPPTDDDSICAAAKPIISSAQKSQDSTLTDWTKTINEGDILAFNVDDSATITRVTLALKVKKIN